jgi:hypothetical protein
MTLPDGRRIALACLAALSQLACGPAEGRGPDRCGRLKPVDGRSWLVERVSQRIPVAHREIRVPTARAQPNPIIGPDRGDLLSVSVVTGVTSESASFDKTDSRLADGWRVWLWRDLADASRALGTSRRVFEIRWPEAGGLRREVAEVFDLPRLDAEAPWRWNPWRRADALIDDEHAWHVALRREEGLASASPPEHPFEVRCRTMLVDEPVVPAAEEDPEILRPEP